MNFGEFHFLRPLWFLVLPVLFLIALFWLRHALNRSNWAYLCDDRLLPYILEQRPERNSRFPWLLFVLAALLSILALAGPTWQRLPLPVYRNESALVIVLDLSKSMDAADIQPSRLGRAQYKISDILQQRKDGLTALVVYSNNAFTVTPLTDDSATISSQLSALETSIMPARGSRASEALKRAVELLKQSGNPSANILLITDGVDEKAFDAAQDLQHNGYRLHVLGIGTEVGAPIPVDGGGFIKDSDGNIVLSKLDSKALDSLARSGGGSYQSLTLDDRDIRAFLRLFDQLKEIPETEQNGKKADQWVEEGPWLLLGVLPIAALAFRRGYLVVLFILILPFPRAVHAWQWKDLWQTRDQQGYQAFQQDDHTRAAELFEDPEWKAAAEYSAGQYPQALDSLNKLETESTAYDKGNALARSGRFEEALEAYKRALELNPYDEDARYNRDLIEKMMKQQESSENQSSNGNNSSDDKQSSSQNQENAESKDSATGQADQQAQQSDFSNSAEKPDKSGNAEKNDHLNSGDQNQSTQIVKQENERTNPKAQDQQANEAQGTSADEKTRLADAEHTRQQELQQANEQWLRQIPDDPAGLLRRKFEYQYKRSNPREASDGEYW
ncbi:MAG: VWA domain-containing protein [Methylococcales bacterium]